LPKGDRIADLAAVAQGSRRLVAWVTYVDPGAPRKKGGLAEADANRKRNAKLFVQSFGADGEPVGAPLLVSPRADFLGGVALATGTSDAHEACLAWTGGDGQRSQVLLTKLDAKGEKTSQRVVSHGVRGTSDVALAAAGDGWIVAWVEERNGEPDIYAARVGSDLSRTGPERRITHAGHSIASLRVAAHGDDVVLAWSQTHGDTAGADVFTTRLARSDLASRGDDVRVATSTNDYRGLDMGFLGDDLVLSWIEGPHPDLHGANSGAAPRAMVARLGPSGPPVVPPTPVASTDPVNSFVLSCAAQGCRAVLGVSHEDQLELAGFVWKGAGPLPTPVRLGRWATVPEDPSPALLGEWLYLAEDKSGAGKVGWMKIAWE
jgi:hypothetical protein